MTNYTNFFIGNQIFARSYQRVVIGGQGAYIEFDPQDILVRTECCSGQEYRYSPKYNNCKYYWLCPEGHPQIKLYYQRRIVSYADYKVGKVYVDPKQLDWSGPLYAEKSFKPGQGETCSYEH